MPHGWLVHNRPPPPMCAPHTKTCLLDAESRSREIIGTLEHSELYRLDGVLLFRGFEPCPGRSGYRQAWLCTPDLDTGAAMVLRMKRPSGYGLPADIGAVHSPSAASSSVS